MCLYIHTLVADLTGNLAKLDEICQSHSKTDIHDEYPRRLAENIKFHNDIIE